MIKEYLLKKVLDEVFFRARKTLANWKADLKTDVRDLELSLDHHMKDVRAWASEISFADLRAAKSTQKVFVPLDVFVSPRRLRSEDDRNPSILPLDHWMKCNSAHLVLLGQPGAGKTTSMKHLCQRLLTDSRFLAEEVKFPILVRLRDLNARQRRSDASTRIGTEDILYSRLQEIFGIRIVFPNDLLLDENVSQRKAIRNQVLIDFIDSVAALLVFDGFDELSAKSTRESVLAEVRELCRLLERSRVLITSRTGEFNYHIEKTCQAEISPLSDSQLMTFACRWLGHENGIRLLQQIRDSPFVDTALRPLTIAHLCAIYERIGKVPDKPKTVYRRIVSLLLHEWDEQRSVRRESAYANFDVDRKSEFLGHMAFVLTVSLRGSVFSKQDLINAYNKIHENFGLPSGDAARVANELESHTGLFVQAGYDHFEFSHKSLQEYLGAEHIVRLPSIPDDSRVLLRLANELAIATAISSTPSEYLAQLVFGRILTLDPPFAFTRVFVNRLLLERPDFERTPRAGAALLALYSQYVSSFQKNTEQLQLFIMDQLASEFAQLSELVNQRIRREDLLEVFVVSERSLGADGEEILLMQKRSDSKGRGPGADARAVLSASLPQQVWVRDSLIA